MKKAIAYCRVSSLQQSEEGVSLEAQVSLLKAYASTKGFLLVEVITDAAVSAGVPLEQRAGVAIDILGIESVTVSQHVQLMFRIADQAAVFGSALVQEAVHRIPAVTERQLPSPCRRVECRIKHQPIELAVHQHTGEHGRLVLKALEIEIDGTLCLLASQCGMRFFV